MRGIRTNSKRGRLLFVAWTTLLVASIVMTMVPLLTLKTGRLLADYHDRLLYFDRGKWLVERTPQISEYPQIPTTLFGITHLATMWLDGRLQRIVYINVFSFEMMLILFLTFRILVELLPSDRVNYSLLLLLPPTMYFTYNRFDILPAFMCLLAFRASIKRQWTLVAILLAIATLTKWYPILLFPGFFLYATQEESKFQWKMILSFIVTCTAVLLLSYFQGGTESILAPYQFHTARGMEHIALPALLVNLLRTILNLEVAYYFLFFFAIQVSGPILVFLTKLDSLDALIHYSIVVIGIFILFSRIWSPQWFVWLMPFLIISAKNKKDAGLIIVYNFMTYLCFPVLFDFYEYGAYRLLVPGVLTYTILVIIIIRSLRHLDFPKVLSLLAPRNLGSAQHTVDSGNCPR